jgi:Zn ribbon nucleic-acid-binding protein
MEEIYDCPICEAHQSVVEVKMGGVNTRICQSCGYQTNEGMIDGTDLEKSIYESQPELFKDLKLVDGKNYVWYPTVLNEVNKAMLFPDGSTVEDWGWRVAKYIPLGKKDKAVPGQTHKLDMVNSTVLPPLMFAAALYLYSTFLRDDNEV